MICEKDIFLVFFYILYIFIAFKCTLEKTLKMKFSKIFDFSRTLIGFVIFLASAKCAPIQNQTTTAMVSSIFNYLFFENKIT